MNIELNRLQQGNGVFGATNMAAKPQEEEEKNSYRKTENGNLNINGSNFLNQLDGREQAQKKKEAARQEAFQLVKDAFESEQSMVDAKKELQEKNTELREENKQYAELVGISGAEKQERLAEAATEEERQAIKEEYAQKEEAYNRMTAENNDEIQGNIAAGREIHKSMLKTHEMFDANQDADKIMESASKTYVGDLMQDGMEYMDEIREEKEKAAEERAEKKAEKEERLEESKAEKQEKQLQSQENTSGTMDISTSYEVISEDMQDEINAGLQKIMIEEKLLPEDLKGIVVDDEI